MATSKSYSNNTGVQVTRQSFDDIIDSVRTILSVEILVGVPSDTTDRPEGLEPQSEGAITNAALAYIHDQGSPEAHIPQREFMRPGIENAREPVAHKLAIAMRAAMNGNALVAEMSMQQAGLIAQLSIQNKISEGIPPPLAEYTLRKRNERTLKGSKSAQYELARRKQGLAPSTQYARPLIDTQEMLKSIKYVIRSRRRRA